MNVKLFTFNLFLLIFLFYFHLIPMNKLVSIRPNINYVDIINKYYKLSNSFLKKELDIINKNINKCFIKNGKKICFVKSLQMLIDTYHNEQNIILQLNDKAHSLIENFDEKEYDFFIKIKQSLDTYFKYKHNCYLVNNNK